MKIDIEDAPGAQGSGYPPPYDVPCRERFRSRLGNVAGLTQFGVNLMRLPPGAWSSQRHWHTAEDEFVYVLEGEVVLVMGGSEQTLYAGDCAGFKAGSDNGHHLQNRSNRVALLLEVGSRRPGEDTVHYSDIDLQLPAGGEWLHRDGVPYATAKPRTPGK